MVGIQVLYNGKWVSVPIAYEVTRSKASDICASLAGQMPKFQYRLIEDGQPPVYFADIQEREKTTIIW